ncbi:MAG: response regulator transcription factor [Nitrospirae bacterium]|nr:response regulator transcription factor [Nitrospirota bacterium]
MISTIIADDHHIVRQGFVNLLTSSKIIDIEIIAEAQDGLEALSLVKEIKPQLLLSDLSMPGLNGLELACEIQKLGIDIKIILLTMHNDPMLIETAMLYGVNGYILKDDSFEDIEYAIKSVLTGGTFISPVLQSHFQQNIKNKQSLQDKLSPRELEILKLVAIGLTSKEIAQKLFISPKTVETHRNRIKEKLNITRTVELVHYVINMGFISNPEVLYNKD